MDLRNRNFVAESIAQKAKVETEETYKQHVKDYQNRNYTYIPLPEDDQFFNVKEGWLRPINSEQWIEPDTHLLDVLELMQEQPFLLFSQPASEYFIINVADLDRRGMREMLYPPIAELESLIASRIQDHHPESEAMIENLSDSAINPRTIGRWYRARQNDTELHIAEYMTLAETKQTLAEGKRALVRSCGFDSEEDITDLEDIRILRNKVMHVNRSLVRSRTEIQEIIDIINRIQELITNATGKF